MSLSCRIFSGSAIAAAVLALAACGSGGAASGTASGPSGATRAYQIFAVEALSGELASYGKAQASALAAGVAIANEHGGFDGARGVLTVKDDQGDPAQAVSLLQQQITSGHTPNLLIPGTSSNETDALLPLAAEAKILVVTNQLSPELNEISKYPYAFSDTNTTDDAESALIQFLQEKGYKSFGFLTQAGADGQSGADSFIKAAKVRGLKVDVAYMPATSIDATPELQQLVASHPDALVFDAYGPAVGYLLQARQELGVTLPTFGDNAFSSNDLVQIAGAKAASGIQIEAITWQVIGSPLEQSAPFKNLFSRLMAENAITTSIEPYVFPYDCSVLAAAASTAARSLETPAVAAAITSITPAHAPLFIGPLGYTRTDHFPKFTQQDYELVPAAKNIDGRIPVSGS